MTRRDLDSAPDGDGDGDRGSERPLEPSADDGGRGDVRRTLLVGGLTLLSRVAGLVREATLALFLGTGVAMDAFRVAFLLPNLLRRLVGEGAISSVFVAVYSRRRGDTTVFVDKFLTLWFSLAALLTIAGVVLVGPCARAVRPLLGDGALAEPENLELTIDVTRVVFWYLFFVGSMAALHGVLNARGRFGAPAGVPLLFNVVFVGSTFALAPFFPADTVVFAVAFAAVLGGIAQLAFLLRVLWRAGARFRLRNPFDDPSIREILRLLVPGVLGAGVYQINIVLNTVIAARLPEGAVSSLGYSNRFMEFVLGIFVVALSTVSLTSLSRVAASGDRDELARRSARMLRLVVVVTIPSTVGLFFIHEPMIALILRAGAFQDESLRLTAAAFRFHVFGLVSVGIVRAIVATFHAQKNLRTPILVSLVVVPVDVVLAAVLSSGTLGHRGIALASSAAAALHATLLLGAYARTLPRASLEGVAGTIGKTLIASGAMAGVLYGFSVVWAAPEEKLLQTAWLAVAVGAGAVTYAGSARLFRLEEVSLLVRSVIPKK